MLKFILADECIKFITHRLEWKEKNKEYDIEADRMVDIINDKSQEFYSIEHLDSVISNLDTKKIKYKIIELDKPSDTLLLKCKGKPFKSYNDALSFVNGTYEEPLTLESLAEIVADIIGGVI